ncbi:hypothetical protein ACJJTC_019378 [Scirpophaga incertulas]
MIPYGSRGTRFPYESPGTSFPYGSPGTTFPYGSPGTTFPYDYPGAMFSYGSPGTMFSYGSPGTMFSYGSPGTMFSYGSPGTFPYGSPGTMFSYGSPGTMFPYGFREMQAFSPFRGMQAFSPYRGLPPEYSYNLPTYYTSPPGAISSEYGVGIDMSPYRGFHPYSISNPIRGYEVDLYGTNAVYRPEITHRGDERNFETALDLSMKRNNVVNETPRLKPLVSGDVIHNDVNLTPESRTPNFHNDVNLTHKTIIPNIHNDVNLTPETIRPNIHNDVNLTPETIRPNIHNDVNLTPETIRPNIHNDVNLTPETIRPNIHNDVNLTSETIKSNIHNDANLTHETITPNIHNDLNLTPEIITPNFSNMKQYNESDLSDSDDEGKLVIAMDENDKPPKKEVNDTSQLIAVLTRTGVQVGVISPETRTPDSNKIQNNQLVGVPITHEYESENEIVDTLSSNLGHKSEYYLRRISLENEIPANENITFSTPTRSDTYTTPNNELVHAPTHEVFESSLENYDERNSVIYLAESAKHRSQHIDDMAHTRAMPSDYRLLIADENLETVKIEKCNITIDSMHSEELIEIPTQQMYEPGLHDFNGNVTDRSKSMGIMDGYISNSSQYSHSKAVPSKNESRADVNSTSETQTCSDSNIIQNDNVVGMEETVFECSVCKQRFINAGLMKTHVSWKHPNYLKNRSIFKPSKTSTGTSAKIRAAKLTQQPRHLWRSAQTTPVQSGRRTGKLDRKAKIPTLEAGVAIQTSNKNSAKTPTKTLIEPSTQTRSKIRKEKYRYRRSTRQYEYYLQATEKEKLRFSCKDCRVFFDNERALRVHITCLHHKRRIAFTGGRQQATRAEEKPGLEKSPDNQSVPGVNNTEGSSLRDRKELPRRRFPCRACLVCFDTLRSLRVHITCVHHKIRRVDRLPVARTKERRKRGNNPDKQGGGPDSKSTKGGGKRKTSDAANGKERAKQRLRRSNTKKQNQTKKDHDKKVTENTFICKFCGNRFVKASSVKAHLRKTHRFLMTPIERNYWLEK